jgi:hypothetical protein
MSQQLLTSSGRHGDIEDTLLTLVMARAAGGKKFDKMNVARVYFGNWLRDYCRYFLQSCGMRRGADEAGTSTTRPSLTPLSSSSSNRCRYR